MVEKKTFIVALGFICVTFVMIVFSRDQRGVLAFAVTLQKFDSLQETEHFRQRIGPILDTMPRICFIGTNSATVIIILSMR
jgi:hypothetical protein